MNKLYTLLLSLSIFVLPSLSTAQLQVDRAILNFKAGERPVQNVLLSNSGGSPFGITVVVKEMINPGSPEEEGIETKNLIVSPKRFTIKNGTQRTIRLLLKKPPTENEHVYRVQFLPRFEGFDDDEAKNGGKSTQLKVITTVGLLILVDPLKREEKLVWNRAGNSIAFKNEGNSYVYLDQGKSCRSSTEDCDPLPVNRVYAGNDWTVSAPAGTTVLYRKTTSNGTENIVVE